ncbi:hypothetical protein TELCIR_12667, partial [Teladorsagia circumcincta]
MTFSKVERYGARIMAALKPFWKEVDDRDEAEMRAQLEKLKDVQPAAPLPSLSSSVDAGSSSATSSSGPRGKYAPRFGRANSGRGRGAGNLNRPKATPRVRKKPSRGSSQGSSGGTRAKRARASFKPPTRGRGAKVGRAASSLNPMMFPVLMFHVQGFYRLKVILWALAAANRNFKFGNLAFDLHVIPKSDYCEPEYFIITCRSTDMHGQFRGFISDGSDEFENEVAALGKELCDKMYKTLKEKFGFSSFRHRQKAAVVAILLGHDAFVLMPTGEAIQFDQNSTQIPCEALTSDLNSNEKEIIYKRLMRSPPDIKLLYVTPEKVPIIALTATATPTIVADTKDHLGIMDSKLFISSFVRSNLIYEVMPKSKSVFARVIQRMKQLYPGKAGIVYCLS